MVRIFTAVSQIGGALIRGKLVMVKLQVFVRERSLDNVNKY